MASHSLQTAPCLTVPARLKNSTLPSNLGIGDKILSQAERFAAKTLNHIMIVVSQRTELIACYQRRGYRKTGQIKPYPLNLNVGEPLSHCLTLRVHIFYWAVVH
ncbi:MAG: hypothetical protein L3J38_03515 [Thiomicrorhabdus sp.]|nr:hypothetical protein [Thiomicrorhabdus sp.]